MGCSTGGGCSSTAGCGSKGGCKSGGCNKMNTYDWLSGMDIGLAERFNIVEVRFKGGRKEFFRNSNNLDLLTGDPIIVDVPNGHHLGFIALSGELVRLQMKKKGVKEGDESIRSVYRLANEKDLEKYEVASNREMNTLVRSRQIVNELNLEMKLSDVEYQADNTKATFFYSADDRVDFRELIKRLATEFKIRVEMKQISLRQEAGRLGGIGSCGRELCCSTWLADFKSVSTSAARYQNLSLNPAKLSGQCGRLKCCLNYELDTYLEALKDIPQVEEPLKTTLGNAYLQKTDIFRKILWFGYGQETNWYPISAERVKEIQELNKKGETPASLEADEIEDKSVETQKELNELSRFDDKFKAKRKKKKKKKSPQSGEAEVGQTANEQASKATSEPNKKLADQQQSDRPKPNRPQNKPKPKGDQQLQAKPQPKGPANKGQNPKGQQQKGQNPKVQSRPRPEQSNKPKQEPPKPENS
jgi:cell fate regulator YaaT (PSP1 superfamily)